MKKIYTFNQRLMNGTVTLSCRVAAFSTKELAMKAKVAVIDANNDDDPLKMVCDVIEETVVYESEEEVPILRNGVTYRL